MRGLVGALVLALLFVLAIRAASPQQEPGKDLSWAFPAVVEQTLPASVDDGGLRHVPGSTRAYTLAQLEDQFNPADWFPDDHAPMPEVVKHGRPPMVRACAACHLASGMGHPESSDLTGLSVEYFVQQMADIRSGARKDTTRMTDIGKATSEADAREAAEWFATLKPRPWVRVVESNTVPKSFIGNARMRFLRPEGGTEPIGNRIITVPEDQARALSRDPNSGFVAYVPVGSIAKGRELATTGGSGKTIPCAMCHGPELKGVGETPRIAGFNPIYIVRQLYNFKTGASNGPGAQLMKPSVAQLTDEDIVALAAYVASQAP